MGSPHFGSRPTSGQRSRSRVRLTPAIARGMSDGTLIDIFEGTRNGLKIEARMAGSLGPAALARAKKQHAIARQALLERGYDAEALDYDPEAHIEETEAAAFADGSLPSVGPA